MIITHLDLAQAAFIHPDLCKEWLDILKPAIDMDDIMQLQLDSSSNVYYLSEETKDGLLPYLKEYRDSYIITHKDQLNYILNICPDYDIMTESKSEKGEIQDDRDNCNTVNA